MPAPLGDRAKLLVIGSHGGVPAAGAEGDAPVVAMVKYPSACIENAETFFLPDDGGPFEMDAVVCAVIARPALRIEPRRALEHIGGYVLLGDVTDRAALEREASTGNALLAKNRRGLSPLGGASAGMPDVDSEISLLVNGRLRQSFRLSELVWSMERAVAFWSVAGLSPGDLVGLGPAALPREERASRSAVELTPGDVAEIRCPSLRPVRMHVGAEVVEERA